MLSEHGSRDGIVCFFTSHIGISPTHKSICPWDHSEFHTHQLPSLRLSTFFDNFITAMFFT